MIENAHDLRVISRMNEDGTNDGSIIELRGHCCYCIAKAPRYNTNEEWTENANLLVDAIKNYEHMASALEDVVAAAESQGWDSPEIRYAKIAIANGDAV